MTSRQFFEYILIELNKVQAPSLLLEDFNYIGNKGIQQYVNKGYNLYDINQQKTDDLRVLKSTAILVNPTTSTDYSSAALLNKTYQINLPDDYLHILNCVVEYALASNYKCYVAGEKIHFGAKRMTADMFPQLLNNYYMKPKYNNPYFYINNVALDTFYPISEVSPIINTGVSDNSLIERVAGQRYGNKSKVRMEIRYGNNDSIFVLNKVYIDYLRSPQFIQLTQAQIDSVEDTSQLLEFPDYVCQEIINEVVKLIMENASDPRLQTNIPVNQSIADSSGRQQTK